jgi:hypothetical protein
VTRDPFALGACLGAIFGLSAAMTELLFLYAFV